MSRLGLSQVAAGLVFAASVAATPTASAALLTYTFEAPIFTLGETTTLSNRAPNVGDAGFLASFSSSPAANGFSILNFVANPLFSGQSLVNPVGLGVPNALTITLNQAVDEVIVDFAVISAASLGLTTNAGGSAELSGGNVGGGFPGGTLSFSGAPFTSFTLSALDVAGAPVLFAIDDLRLTTVPEPGTLALLGLGLAGLAATRRRKQ